MNRRALSTIIEPVSFTPSTGEAIERVARCGQPAILDSASPDPNYGRWTILTCEPIATFTCGWADSDPFESMRILLAATGMLHPTDPDHTLPFTGGWIGYFAYEAGCWIEKLPHSTTRDVGLPLARFALYDSAALFDHRTGSWHVVATDFGAFNPGSVPLEHPLARGPRPSIRDRVDWWKELLAEAATTKSAGSPTPSAVRNEAVCHNLSYTAYLDMVRRGREYIAAGDIFQVNLTRRESIRATEPPLQLYRRLRQTNPGAYSAFLSWPGEKTGSCPPDPAGCAILSSSPELFLDLGGREVLTRPIKGTRPRSADPATDEALRLELAASSKDRAELAMIVDLERNDLGRLCEFGSIRVLGDDSPAAPYALEPHPTVHHLAAAVAGRLSPGRDCVDLLRATFPGGSITGAPKVRAMEIIDELEPTERSVYTGAIGYFTSGRMVMNIAIRTMLQARGNLHWYVGGGIVADSDPDSEYEETRAKALGMRRSLGLEEACRIGEER